MSLEFQKHLGPADMNIIDTFTSGKLCHFTPDEHLVLTEV